MKRIICLLLLCALLCGCIVGCGKSDDETTLPADSYEPDTDENMDEPPAAEGPFALSRDSVVLVTEGENWVLYDGGVDQTQIVWSSDDETVATIEDGVVTAIGDGTTMVHADYLGSRYSCTVTCNIRFYAGVNTTDPPEKDEGGPYGEDERDPVQPPPSPARVDASFFDDAVFVGDSVTLKLSYYAASSGKLGKAQFLTRGSYSASHAVRDSMLLTYQGQDMRIEDAIAATGATKAFIMLGMNDIGLYGIDKTIENWGALVKRIQEKCPGVTIYIQSMTPIWTGGETGDLNNENMDEYNKQLQAFAQREGIDFIDIAPYMKDSTGGLATRYCSDSFVHVTDLGSAAWIRVLKAYEY